MLRRVARLLLAVPLAGVVSCGGASLPPLGRHARVVPTAVRAPSSCDPTRGDADEPRKPTAIEDRMASAPATADGARDLEACRALCRRALGPGEDVVSCYSAQTEASIGCEGAACPENDHEKLGRRMFCGAEGRRAAADPVAAQAALPFFVRQGDTVIVCSVR